MGAQVGVEGGQGGVVGARLGERQADEPAHQQVGCEQLFQGRAGAAVGPGADELHADELGDAEGGRGARGAWGVMEARTGGDDGGGVIPLGQQHKGVVGAAPQQRVVDQGLEPGQDRGRNWAILPWYVASVSPGWLL